ncbi:MULTISPECIES: hypothetical protein [unclassified Pseudomonas]|uniref:hypothetical protein n=1 Tax=unclassified Pseudomonas TaxID=196821 RepID=UPI0023614F92|nr:MULTISPECIES: hypothetical protein [unclassified Pseudomonas]
MAISCGDPKRLIEILRLMYPKATFGAENAIGTVKITFPDRLVVNVFANGTVNFQGQASPIKGQIEEQIEIVNKE